MHPEELAVRAGCLWADSRHASAPEFAATCRAVAVRCIADGVDRVLIDATDCEADGAMALRDAFTMMILAGLPSGFKLALVTNVPHLEALFGTLQRDLALLRVPVRRFADPAEAADWLAAVPERRPAEAQAQRQA